MSIFSIVQDTVVQKGKNSVRELPLATYSEFLKSGYLGNFMKVLAKIWFDRQNFEDKTHPDIF